jgi:hypothetical protein
VPLAFRAGSESKQRIHIFWCKRIREDDTTTPWWFPSQTTGGSIMEDRLVFPIPPGVHWSDAKPIVLPRHTHAQKQLAAAGEKKIKPPAKIVTRRAPLSGGLMFSIPQSAQPPTAEKSRRPKRQKMKNDPKFVAAARELRDRYLEQVNAGAIELTCAGKYQVSRAIGLKPARPAPPPLLAASEKMVA